MGRKLLIAMIAVGALLVAAIPATAKNSHQRRSHKVLVLTVREGKSIFKGRAHRTSAINAIDPSPPMATVSAQGFRCEVTVGTGSNDLTAKNFSGTDSSEFYFASSPGHNSVTTNCVGMLPASTARSSAIVSHNVACRQYDPFNPSAPTIQGYGISTTYPDGLYSETCNTPNF
jgi:hypothetical protein